MRIQTRTEPKKAFGVGMRFRPREIVNRLSSEMARILASAEMKERLEKLGIDAVGSTPADAARFLDDEIRKWAKVINTAGIKAEQ